MVVVFGIGLAFVAAMFATLTGFEKGGAFLPTALAIVASYYDLFSAMGGMSTLTLEIMALVAFAAIAIVGLRGSLWTRLNRLSACSHKCCAHGGAS